MTDTRVWHSDPCSMACTGAPVALNSGQMKKFQASPRKLVIQNLVTDIDLEATEEYNIMCAASILIKERVTARLRAIWNRPPGDETVNIHDVIHARSHLSWKRLLRESALRQKYREEANCAEIVRCDSEIDSRTKFGDLGSVRIKLVNFHMGKAVPGERQRSNQAHEGERFMYSQTLYCAPEKWTNSNIPTMDGKADYSGLRTQNNTENWMESVESRWNSSEWYSQGTPHCRFSSRSKTYWRNWIVNLNNSKEEWSSCRCTTTSDGDTRRTIADVWLMHSLWLLMPGSSLWVTGHSSGQVQKRNGTRQTLSSLEENETELQSAWWVTSVKVVTPYFVQPVHWTEDNCQ